MPKDDMQLAQLTHAQLLNLRRQPGADQDLLAPLEHRAFARELVEERPEMALSLGVAIPAYTAAKIVSRMEAKTPITVAAQQVARRFAGQARSKPSIREVTESFKGIGEGIVRRGRTKRRSAAAQNLEIIAP